MNTNWNNFWGETLSGGENIQVLVMYYTHKNLSVGLGAFNPFTDNYKQQTENWNKYASYKKTNYVKELSLIHISIFCRPFCPMPQRLSLKGIDFQGALLICGLMLVVSYIVV